MALTVREFLRQMYSLINASNPTVPLHGNDELVGLRVLNQLLNSYASSGLMLTIAQTVTVPVNLGIRDVLFVPPDYSTTTTQTEIVTLTTASASFTVLDGTLYHVGDAVTGAGIPALTTILDINVNVITLTNDATITGLSSLTFTHDLSDPSAVYIRSGRLANLDNAWLILNGVTYPLIYKSRDDYLSAWKYDPLQSLPRFIILFPETQIVSARLYPAPSQFYQFYCRGKFQKTPLTIDDTLEGLPNYFELFLLYAVAKYVAKFKARGSAWTPDLEADYQDLKLQMEGASEINLSIMGDEQNILNGAWRVRAGI